MRGFGGYGTQQDDIEAASSLQRAASANILKGKGQEPFGSTYIMG